MEMLANALTDSLSLSKETQFKADFHHISEVIDRNACRYV
jgi:LacI family transcriptional regulator